MKPHKHCDLIKAWADGAEIEYRGKGSDDWFPLFSGWSWDNSLVAEYRIKPEPKPDVVRFYNIGCGGGVYQVHQNCCYDLKLTFDGETGNPKSAEVLR